MALNTQQPSAHQSRILRSWKAGLFVAAKKGDALEVNRLLRKRVLDVDARDKDGKTPLMLAMESCHTATVAVLFEFNANVFVKSSYGKCALQMAMELGLSNWGIVKMFLKVVREGCRNDVHELAARLIKIGCPLYFAVILRDSEVLKVMLQKGCSVNDKDPDTQQTALHVAVALQAFSSVRSLIEHGADVNAMDLEGKIPFVAYQSFDDSEEELEMLRMLTDRCTTLTARNNIGLMQVWLALKFAKKEALRILLRAEIDWRATDMFGISPIYYLCGNEAALANQDLLEELRSREIYDSARDCSSIRVLPFVSASSLTKLVELLLDSGVDPNSRNSDGQTALLSAARFEGSPELIEENRRTFRLLLQRGADLQARSDDGRTVFDSIAKYENLHLAESALGQLAIDETAGTPINDDVWTAINSHRQLQEQFLSCKKQLEQLKRTKLRHSVTLFDLLRASETRMALYARNKKFSCKLTSLKKFSSNAYFDYVIRKKFDKTMELVRLRKDAADMVCRTMAIHYDSYPAIVDKIVDYIICK